MAQVVEGRIRIKEYFRDGAFNDCSMNSCSQIRCRRGSAAMATSNEVASCSWSRQDSYASTTASSYEPVGSSRVWATSFMAPKVDDMLGGGSDEHPAFAMLSGDEHPAAHALLDGDWQAKRSGATLFRCRQIS